MMKVESVFIFLVFFTALCQCDEAISRMMYREEHDHEDEALSEPEVEPGIEIEPVSINQMQEDSNGRNMLSGESLLLHYTCGDQ